MRILAINSGVPTPTEGASSILFHHYLAGLCGIGTMRNILLLTPDWSDAAAEAHRLRMMDLGVESVHAFRTPALIQSLGCEYCVDEDIATRVKECAIDFRPDVVVEIDLAAAMAAYRLNDHVRIAWLGDLNFDTHRYHTTYAWQEGRIGLLGLLRKLREARRWRSTYAQILSRHAAVLVASKSSVRRLAPLGINATYQPYPWPVGRRVEMSTSSPIQPSFVFFGTLGALGSRSAFHFLLRKLYPRLVRLWGRGGFVISICGRGDLPRWVHSELDSRPEIAFRGFVPNVNDALDNCHALIVPIDIPVGNRSRILTAMARSVPVVAHQNTALGNPALIDGHTCRLAANAKDFVEQMRQVVENREETAEIVKRGYEMYWELFSPDHAVGVFCEFIRSLVAHCDRSSQDR